MGLFSALFGIGDDDCSHDFSCVDDGRDGYRKTNRTPSHKCRKCGKKERCHSSGLGHGDFNNRCDDCGIEW